MKSPGKKKRPSPAPPTRRRLWLFRLTALLVPLILIALLELGLRLGGYGFDPHFFKPQMIGGEKFLVQNEEFSFRFFPRETARHPNALRFRAEKPPGTIRIFVLGESAAMGDPEPAFGPARFMEILLREKFPGTQFEVVNLAFTAINSHVILPIARECARQEGDFWIIYMGNNEMVGPFGAATVFGKQAPPLPYVRLVTALKATRTGQLFSDLAGRLRGGKSPATSWGGMQMFLNNQVAPDSPLKENVYRNFAKNLEDIVRAGTGSGAKILLNTVAVNLKDCPPFASISASATNAAGEFQRAQNLTAENNFAGAGKHFQLAADLDALPFRTDSRENGAIRATAEKFSAAKVRLLDSAARLGAGNPEKVCGDETFFEHVHFDFDGSFRLGKLWAEQVESSLPAALARNPGWLTPVECEARLGLTPWNGSVVLEHMAKRLLVPPFSGQPGNSNHIARLQARIATMKAGQSTEAAIQTRKDFLAEIAAQPGDVSLWENYALFLQMNGDLAGSQAAWRKAGELMPQDFLPHLQLARLAADLGQAGEAEAQFRAALKIRPSLSEAWLQLGVLLMKQGNLSEALNAVTIARAQRPQDAETIFRIGKIRALQGDRGGAVGLYQDAIRLNPGLWEPHYELAGELDADGQTAGALAEFAEAARLNPNYSRARFNFGVLLAKSGRLDDAQREFEAALRLEPGYPNAQDALAKIRLLRQQNLKPTP